MTAAAPRPTFVPGQRAFQRCRLAKRAHARVSARRVTASTATAATSLAAANARAAMPLRARAPAPQMEPRRSTAEQRAAPIATAMEPATARGIAETSRRPQVVAAFNARAARMFCRHNATVPATVRLRRAAFATWPRAAWAGAPSAHRRTERARDCRAYYSRPGVDAARPAHLPLTHAGSTVVRGGMHAGTGHSPPPGLAHVVAYFSSAAADVFETTRG
jgi:hypothetical protein